MIDKEIKRTRLLFIMLCVFILSQAFTIPLLPIGPAWAVWPTLSDIAIIGLMIASIRLTNYNKTFHRYCDSVSMPLLAMLTLFVASYLALSLIGINSLDIPYGQRKGPAVGLFEIYRLIQAGIAFWSISKLVLTPTRKTILSNILLITISIVILGVILTFTGIVRPAAFAPFLPVDFDVAGPWGYYLLSDDAGLGAIGYNHGYVGLQLLLLMMTWMHLSGGINRSVSVAVVLLIIVAVFMSSSRAGLASVAFFAVVMLIRKTSVMIIAITAVLMCCLLLPGTWFASEEGASTVERQTALLDPTDSTSLNGRDEIWETAFSFMNEKPSRWLHGIGFGSAFDGPGNVHMMFFHTIVECGVFISFAFIAAIVLIAKAIYKMERQPRPFFWGTVALLLTCLTQETFYPVPAFGNFLGFYLCMLRIVMLQGAIENRDKQKQFTSPPQFLHRVMPMRSAQGI